MITLYVILCLLVGFALGVCAAMYFVSRDNDLVHLQEDEVIIKRPMSDFVLVQVTPEVARRLVQNKGEEIGPNASEARSLYPEKAMKSMSRPNV